MPIKVNIQNIPCTARQPSPCPLDDPDVEALGIDCNDDVGTLLNDVLNDLIATTEKGGKTGEQFGGAHGSEVRHCKQRVKLSKSRQ